MGRGRALLKCNIAVAGQYREYGYAKVSGWISNLGGNPSTSVNDKTTHVVATEKAWKRKDGAIKHALRLNKDNGTGIKIVSFDWLEDSVNNKTKKREGPYLWQKLDASVAKQDAAKARAEKAVAKKAKGYVGMMAEVFDEATKDYIDPKEAREVERRIEEQKRIDAAVEEEKRREKEAKRLKHAERFKRGTKKARNEIFSENHHIYADDTTFRYEVVCTKVDTRHNRNERVALTIYESNSAPHTYAVNYHYAGTGLKVTNEIIVPMGSPFPAAFHGFKKAFKERTKCDWDDRISHAIERGKTMQRDRWHATSSVDQGSRKGEAVSEQTEEEKRKRADEEFSALPFEYHPPKKGPRGRLPNDKELATDVVRGSNAAVEKWTSGALPADNDADAPIEIPDDEPEEINDEVNDFSNLVNGDDSSIFDKDVDYWVKEQLDTVYPFDHHQENMEYLNQTNGVDENADMSFDSNGMEENGEISFSSTNTLEAETDQQAEPDFGNGITGEEPVATIDTGFTNDQDETFFDDTNANEPNTNIFDNSINNDNNDVSFQNNLPNDHQDISFDPLNTNMTEAPISFDLPSTVQDSFQPGTQSVTETQLAERAQGELDELLNHTSPSPNLLTTEADAVDTPHTTSFDFDNSVLGKRKTPDPDSSLEMAEIMSPKKLRFDDDQDEDEAFALAAEEAFDAHKNYQFGSSANFEPDGGMDVPRVLLDENGLFSSGYLANGGEGMEVEGDGYDEVEAEVQYGRA